MRRSGKQDRKLTRPKMTVKKPSKFKIDKACLVGGKCDGDVGRWTDVQRLQLHVRGVGVEAQGSQILASKTVQDMF